MIRLGAQLPLHGPHPRRGLQVDRPARGQAGQDALHRRGDGHKVTVAGAWDSEEEARQIGDEIEALQTKGHPLNEMAILVRASFQMREFEERFITLGLPYRVIGGPRFYERREVRDALVICASCASG